MPTHELIITATSTTTDQSLDALHLMNLFGNYTHELFRYQNKCVIKLVTQIILTKLFPLASFIPPPPFMHAYS